MHFGGYLEDFKTNLIPTELAAIEGDGVDLTASCSSVQMKMIL